MKRILILIVILLTTYLLVQGVRCYLDLGKAKDKLNAYDKRELNLSYGKVTYIDEGEGEVILSVHGIFGGYDQAYENIKSRVGKNRVIAPSRFGYLGSSIKEDATPRQQAKAFNELLDSLEIEQVFVLGTSAGGTPAIRFALDYPDRVKGLVLYCSAMPVNEKPDKYLEYQAPPEPLLSNYAMYLISPLMPLAMGMPASIVKDIMPIAERKEGVVIDGKVTNPDMERNFDTVPKSVSEPIKKHSLKILLVLYFTKNKTVKFKDYVTIKGTTFFCNGQTFRARKWPTRFNGDHDREHDVSRAARVLGSRRRQQG